MKAIIPVKTRVEKRAIEAALDDPQIRAFVVVVGVLQPLDAPARRRALNWVAERCASDARQKEN
jgi:hypothetical protein